MSSIVKAMPLSPNSKYTGSTDHNCELSSPTCLGFLEAYFRFGISFSSPTAASTISDVLGSHLRKHGSHVDAD